MTKMHSPNQAAKVAKVSRSTISRVLKSGELRGIRDNSGHWRIKEEDLREWMGDHQHTVRTVTKPEPIPDRTAEIEQLQSEINHLQADVQRLAEDRDAWRQLAQTLAGKRWWDFLRRK